MEPSWSEKIVVNIFSPTNSTFPKKGWKATDVTEVISAYSFLTRRVKGGGGWQKQRERREREGGRAGVCVSVCMNVCVCGWQSDRR